MVRILIFATFSVLISFGAFSKTQTITKLLGHVVEDHVAHSHDADDHHHDHGHDDSDEPDDRDHSHDFDLSYLSQVSAFESITTEKILITFQFSEMLKHFEYFLRPISNFTFSIFRPPIA